MQEYKETIKLCDGIVPEDIIEIGGVLYQVTHTVESVDVGDIWIGLSLVTVLSEQELRPFTDKAVIRLPRSLFIKTMK